MEYQYANHNICTKTYYWKRLIKNIYPQFHPKLYIKQNKQQSTMQKQYDIDVSGTPGVGKTASINQIVKKVQHQTNQQVKFHFINCMTLRKPSDIYRLILNRLTQAQIWPENKQNKGIIKKIQKTLTLLKNIFFFIIDQIDFLFTKDQKIFYNLFQWSHQFGSKICFITIANTMNFPQLLSQKIKSRMGNHRLVFKPYTFQQIQDIVADRLKGCDYFSKNSLNYACKKLVSYSSDIRTILQILHQAVEIHKQKKHRRYAIGIDQLCLLWQKKSNRNYDEKVEQLLNEEYKLIIDYLKNNNNTCKSSDLSVMMHQNGLQSEGTLWLLKQLQQMKLIKLNEIQNNINICYLIKLVQR